jgi:uncharacterized iron-regulated membrane protein
MSTEKRRRRAWRLPSHAILHWWDLHSWAGVVGGLVLYIMFAAGATTLFHHELEVWEEPIHQRAAPPERPLEPLLAQAYGALRAGSDPRSAPPEPAEAGAADGAKVDPKAPSLAAFWFFPPHPGRGEAAVAYQDGAGTWHTAYVDSSVGAKAGAPPSLIEPRERLAHFLYALHYLWHDLTGQWLYIFAGLLAVAFLLVVVTGVLVHLKNLKKQFHQFRPKRSRHALWADLHKVLGVLGLPFQLMYAYTGAMLVLGPLLGQLLVGPLFGGDERRAAAVIAGASYEQKEPSGAWLHQGEAGAAAPRGVLGASLDELIARAQARAPRMEVDAVQIVAPGTSHGYVEISGYDRASSPHGRTVVTLRSATAEELSPPPELQSPEADTARRWVRGLHFAQLGGFGTRALLFLLTLAGCATILSGNALWLVRREERAASASNRILAKLTVGVGAGLWVAFGAIFVASRALPWGLEGRGAIEELIFLGTLVACIGWAMAARSHAHTWWRQLLVAAVLLAAAPLLAALRSSAGALGGLHVPAPGAPRSAGMMAEVVGVDVALWLMAVLIGACAWWLRRVAQRLDTAAAKKASTSSTITASAASAPGMPGGDEEPS